MKTRKDIFGARTTLQGSQGKVMYYRLDALTRYGVQSLDLRAQLRRTRPWFIRLRLGGICFIQTGQVAADLLIQGFDGFGHGGCLPGGVIRIVSHHSRKQLAGKGGVA